MHYVHSVKRYVIQLDGLRNVSQNPAP